MHCGKALSELPTRLSRSAADQGMGMGGCQQR